MAGPGRCAGAPTRERALALNSPAHLPKDNGQESTTVELSPHAPGPAWEGRIER
jgi:hypothetical protein